MDREPPRPGPAARGPACPICGGAVPPGEAARPFCSARCKMVDLGRWFAETYRVPGEDAVDFTGLGEENPPGPHP